MLPTDAAFDAQYLAPIRRHAFTHFTPVNVAHRAAAYLAPRAGVQVLDVGSGAGKFCCVGALTTPGFFTGVERRPSLHTAAHKLAIHLDLDRVSFILDDVLNVDFGDYDAFFLFNPFYENLGIDTPIDDSVALKKEQYRPYCAYVLKQLAARPPGTRLATYYSFLDDVPQDSYRPVGESGIMKLRFWERQ